MFTVKYKQHTMFTVMIKLNLSSYLTAAIFVSPTIMPTVSFQFEVSEEIPVVTLNCLPVQVVALAISIIGEASIGSIARRS